MLPKFVILFAVSLFFVLTAVFLQTAQPTYAGQATPQPTPEELCNAQTGKCKTDLGIIDLSAAGIVNTVKFYSLVLGGGIALVFIIWGGFTIVTSAGNPTQLKRGKDIVTYALIGLIMIVFSVWIVILIGGGTLGVPCFQGQC